jgi:hypothetical protein
MFIVIRVENQLFLLLQIGIFFVLFGFLPHFAVLSFFVIMLLFKHR